MPSFDINVRAIVNVTVADPDATGALPTSWELYDWDTAERDAAGNARVATLRCDQTLRVDADDAGAAVEAAKANADAITVDGYTIENVQLWVDEDLDISPVSAPAP